MASTEYYCVINYMTNGTTGTGFVDNMRIEQYMANSSSPTTVAQSLAKERGNSRYELIQQKLGLLGNIYISNVTASGANAITNATAFSFNATSEHGDACLRTEDEDNLGTYLEGNIAIRRAIARALVVNREDFLDYYDPTLVAAKGDNNANTTVRMGVRIDRLEVGQVANSIANAEASITVTPVV